VHCNDLLCHEKSSTKLVIVVERARKIKCAGASAIVPAFSFSFACVTKAQRKDGTMMSDWSPPELVSRETIVKDSEEVLSMPELRVKKTEDIFRIRTLGMDWDIGAVVYEPEDPSRVPAGPDGRKAGFFILHGGSGDFKHMETLSLLLSQKFGHKVVAGTFPGGFYFSDPSRDWPGDTLRSDGTVRTPIWKDGEPNRTRRIQRCPGRLDARPVRDAAPGARPARHELLLPHGRLLSKKG
jgi:hypothetical protein